MTTVRHGLSALTRYLRDAGIEGAARDARLLLAHAMRTDPARMTLIAGDALDQDVLAEAYDLAGERANRVPISHILGGRQFFGRWFHVTRHVLDPRPETESLIAAALAEPFAEVLDLGTGSGAIVVTLLAERAGAAGIGTDISEPALEIARRNATELGVRDRVRFEPSDWYSVVGGTYDLIVSNPPYIAASEMTGLAPELSHEPRIALTDEGDGLSAYRAIAAGLCSHLAPGGRVLLEIGPTQARAVTQLLAQAGLGAITVLPDLDGRDRVISARNPR